MSEMDDFADRYIGVVDKIITKIPYKRLAVWKEFFLNPVATVRKDRLGILQRMKDIVAAKTISAAIGLVAAIPVLIITAIGSAGVSLIFTAVVPLLMVLGIIAAPILGFLYSLLELLVAKIAGGTGDMRANFNASALPGLGTMVITLPISLVAVPLAWLSAIPFVNICLLAINIPLAIVGSLVGLYSLYLKYLGMKEVHKLSTLRTVAVVIVPPIFLAMVIAVAVIALYAFFVATVIGLSSAMQISS